MYPSLEQGVDRVQSDVAYTVSAFRYGTLSRMSCSFISMKGDAAYCPMPKGHIGKTLFCACSR